MPSKTGRGIPTPESPLSRPRRAVRIFPVKRRTKAGPFEKRKTRSRIRSAVSDAPRRTARQRLFHGDRHRIVRNENCRHPKKNGLCMRAVFADIRAKKQSVPEPSAPERFVRQIEKLFLFRLDYSFPHPGVGLNVLKLVIVHNAQIAVAESFGDRHRNLRLRFDHPGARS